LRLSTHDERRHPWQPRHRSAGAAALPEPIRPLRNAARNFFINGKLTGAAAGQQPFGGARGSGTNDKAGSILNLVRWISPRTIKGTFAPARSFEYPFMCRSRRRKGPRTKRLRESFRGRASFRRDQHRIRHSPFAKFNA